HPSRTPAARWLGAGADQETADCRRRRAGPQPPRAQRQAPRGGKDGLMEAFEYAIKKDVRNNPIVREVDEARQRELWTSIAIAGFLVVVLVLSAWQHFELLRHGYEVEELQRQRSAEEETS